MLEEPKEPRSHAGASYLSYLLRMWSVSGPGEGEGGEGGGERWLVSLESPLTREQHNFTDLDSLFAFLRTTTGQGASDDAKVSIAKGRES